MTYKNVKKIIRKDSSIIIPEHDDELVLKKWNDIDKSVKEYESLKKINSLFQDQTINGWKYKSIKVHINDEQGNIWMEKATGKDIRYDIISNPDVSHHAGIWLALYHNNCIKDKKVPIFGDYSGPNIIIDSERKVVVAIDPGKNYGIITYPEVDVLYYILKTAMTSLRSLKSPKQFIDSFIFGYNSYSSTKISVENIEESIIISSNIMKEKWSEKKTFKRVGLYTLMYFLSKYIKRVAFKLVNINMKQNRPE